MTAVSFVDIRVGGRSLDIEYQWLRPLSHPGRPALAQAPLVVFLHEGLGSLAMWKDYPQQLCDAGGYTGLVFSRTGYGRSTPRPPDERWPVTFMHAEAQHVLPQLFERLRVGSDGHPPWLFGHSDGASIALIHASLFPDAVAGVIAVAPHVFVEELSIRSIEQARDAYLAADLKARLARYHEDPDSAFWGWNDVWLDPAFRHWKIEAQLAAIRCPVLAVQGENDEYGTLEQVRGIQRRLPKTRLLILPNCGHSPHRDQAHALIEHAGAFIVAAGT